jgi:hypothetical protein
VNPGDKLRANWYTYTSLTKKKYKKNPVFPYWMDIPFVIFVLWLASNATRVSGLSILNSQPTEWYISHIVSVIVVDRTYIFVKLKYKLLLRFNFSNLNFDKLRANWYTYTSLTKKKYKKNPVFPYWMDIPFVCVKAFDWYCDIIIALNLSPGFTSCP